MRAKIASGVRRALLMADPEGALVKSYMAARSAPLVRAIWRRLDPHAKLTDVERYAAKGGTFAAAPAPGAPPPPPAPAVEAENYFEDLLARVEASQGPYEPVANRVVLVNNGLSAGGAERQIVYTLAGLARRGWDVRFIGEYLGVARGHDFHLAAALGAGVDARPARPLARPLSQVYASVTRDVAEALSRFPAQVVLEILAMVDELRAARPAVVHLWQDETSIKHGISALIAGAPRIVLSGRNLNPSHFAHHRSYMRSAYRALAARPAVVLSNNSHAGAASYADWLGLEAGAIRVVTNGVDPGLWPARTDDQARAWRAEHGLDADVPLVVGVFRLSEEKRPLLWLEVAARARRALPQLRLVLIGDGPMRTPVDARIRDLALKGAIVAIRELDDVSLPIAAADALMLTSAQEGLPNVLIEAQWYGRPCLTTNAGGAAEAIEDGVTGLVARSDRTEDLADALVRMLGDRALAKSARRRGPLWVTERFGLDRMLDATERLYRQS